MMVKRKEGRAGFWEPGFSIFADGLTKEEKSRLGQTQAELKAAADPSRRDELKRNIAAVKTEFRAKRTSARYNLFAET